MSVTTNLSVFDAADSAGNWGELAGHLSGGAPAATSENYWQNGTAVDQSTGQATGNAPLHIGIFVLPSQAYLTGYHWSENIAPDTMLYVDTATKNGGCILNFTIRSENDGRETNTNHLN